MHNQTLFRVGGIAAILAAVSNITFPIFFFSGNESLGTLSTIIAALMFLVLMIPLSIDLRADSQRMVAVAAILFGASTIWSLFLDPVNVNPLFFGAMLSANGLGLVLYGWLQYRSERYPNAMGIIGLLFGLVYLVAGILMLIGVGANSDSMAGAMVLIPVATILQLVWLLWLGLHYLRSRTPTLAAA